MEPMALGSPSNSGPSSPATTPSGSPFLPSFLLGEPQSPLPGSTSPKLKRVSFSDGPFSSKDYPRQDLRSPAYMLNQSIRSPTAVLPHYTSVEKGSGPPIRGLFDTVNSSQPVNETNTNDVHDYLMNASKQYCEQRLSPVGTANTTDNTWVTVFGYPPSAASFILAQLAHCGNIVATKAPAKGNWVHVQYSSKLEARRALSNNGKVFAGTVMIGVVACRDQGIIALCNSDKENHNKEPLSPIASSSHGLYPDLSKTFSNPMSESSIYESPVMSPRFINARNLQCHTGDTQIFAAANTPQKNTGLVAKAMEYVFGW